MPTILFFDSEDPEKLVGFGTWAHIEARSASGEVERHIEISYLAVHSDYEGTKAASGHSCAKEIFATVYRDALTHEDSRSDMPITLACHVSNERAQAFLAKQGFVKTEDIEIMVPGSEPDSYDRMVLGRRPDAGASSADSSSLD